MSTPNSTAQETNKSLVQKARAWGENSFPPTILATLIAAQHMRPFQPLPMLFPPVLLFASYANLQGYKIDSAGISGAWAGLYVLLAGRRRQRFAKKFGARGIVRGLGLGVGFANFVGGGLAYVLGRREREDEEREGGDL